MAIKCEDKAYRAVDQGIGTSHLDAAIRADNVHGVRAGAESVGEIQVSAVRVDVLEDAGGGGARLEQTDPGSRRCAKG